LETVQDRCKLVLIHLFRKLHAGFHFVPKVVTLSDLEPRNGCYFNLFTSFYPEQQLLELAMFN